MSGLRMIAVAGLALGLLGHGPGPATAETPTESALMTVIGDANQLHRDLTEAVADYTCTLVKRERVKGQLLGHEYMELKLRHRQVRDGQMVVPFSVYLRFLSPDDVQGREVIFVEGRNDGKIIARRGGRRFAYVTTAVDPLSDLAMERNRYPITHVGIKNLIDELLVVGEEELQNPPEELEVKQIDGAKVAGRTCRVIQFTHPVQREQYRYHIARIFVDQELNIPIRYAAYDFADEEGGLPKLLEEYTYVNLKLNVGLTDWDFDHRNEAYQFLKEFQP